MGCGHNRCRSRRCGGVAGVQQVRVATGQVWLVTLDPAVANEQRDTRPCIVVSTDRFNALPIRHAIVVPLTTRERGLPHHIPVADDGGLSRHSWAMCEAVRAVSTERFSRLVGTATGSTLAAIIDQLVLWLGRHGRPT
ncbi:MAG: type II toxin-antitoxin system PemK/MazF family toxin [Streptosporangiales bacterium]|nr:type II toxin-antitoxin system PemK/MazF family toxin [Streptosporangiales bacterium]